MFCNHPSEEVNAAMVKLCDALCSWERSTGRESILILREPGFCFRAMSGKPGVPEDVPYSQLVQIVSGS